MFIYICIYYFNIHFIFFFVRDSLTAGGGEAQRQGGVGVAVAQPRLQVPRLGLAARGDRIRANVVI